MFEGGGGYLTMGGKGPQGCGHGKGVGRPWQFYLSGNGGGSAVSFWHFRGFDVFTKELLGGTGGQLRRGRGALCVGGGGEGAWDVNCVEGGGRWRRAPHPQYILLISTRLLTSEHVCCCSFL